MSVVTRLSLMKYLLASILLFVLPAVACSAASADSRVVILVANNLSIRDIANPTFPHLNALLRDGSAGLMNVRTGRSSRDVEDTVYGGMEAACVSIGAGAMAVGGAEVRRAAGPDALISGVAASSIYACRTGDSGGKAAVLHTEIVKIVRANETASYRAVPGNLGSILHLAGIKTAVIGNSDFSDMSHREAVSIAMDRSGRVDYGNVSSPNLVVPDPKAPYGVRTDSQTILRELERVSRVSRFIVIDFGDTLRADRYAESCTRDQAVFNKHRSIAGLNKLVGQLVKKLDVDKDLLVLLSPAPPSFTDLEEERLTPVVFYGPGYRSGFLLSASTRREGVVTISDIAPSVLSFLDIKDREGMTGREVGTEPGENVGQTLQDINLNASLQAQRQSAMRGSSVVQSVVVVLVTVCVLLFAAYPIKRFAVWLALVPAALPVTMLVLPLVCSFGLVGAVIVLSVITAAVVVLCAALMRSPLRAFVWLCGALVFGLMVDLLIGAPIISASIAGYNLAEGARYYGIGNELMGTMLGAALIGTGAALAGVRLSHRVRVLIATVVLALLFIFIGLPSLGANTGGALAAVPAVAVMLLVRQGWKPSVRGVALIVVITVLAVGSLFALDAVRGAGSQSHMGRVVGAAANGGGSELLMVFQRKLALNFMLVSTSLWSRLLGLSILASGLIYWWSRKMMGNSFLDREESAAVMGCTVGIAAAFIFNDSGVVAAATCAVFLWMFLVLKTAHCPITKKKAGG